MIAKILVSPKLEARVGEIKKILQISQIPVNHPDLLHLKAGEKLGIEQARIIKEHFSFKPYQLEGKVVIIEDASLFTMETQNALLKTLEELPEKAIFIMGVNSEENLLPTVLSRCQMIYLPTSEVDEPVTSEVAELLDKNIEERFEYIEKLKDKEQFLHSLLVYFQRKLHAQKGRPGSVEIVKFLKELLQAEEWMKHNVNQRAILEYLMLIW